jgi:hypothetical protein
VTPEISVEDEGAKRRASTPLKTPVKLLIAIHFTAKHFPSEDSISTAFVSRLNQFASVSASPLGNLKRDDAVKRAKTETNAFVVFLNFDIDSIQDRKVIINSQNLEIEYSLYAPGNGKQVAKGKVYYQPIGGGGLRESHWPNGTPIKITSEAAGLEAAEQLHVDLRVIDEEKN